MIIRRYRCKIKRNILSKDHRLLTHNTRKAKLYKATTEFVNIEPWTKKESFAEIGQSVGVKYAFLSPDNKQCHGWIKCRDFLHDALRNFISGGKDGVYGFAYDPSINPPLDLEHMRILVKIEDSKTTPEDKMSILTSGLRIINFLEEQSGISPLTKIINTDQEGVYLFESHGDWMSSTFMISLYTFIIRLGAKKIEFNDKTEFDSKISSMCDTDKTSSDHDITYLKKVWPYMYKILQKRESLKYIQGDKKPLLSDKNISLFHNYTGIVALVDQAKAKELTANNKSLEDLYEMAQCLKQ